MGKEIEAGVLTWTSTGTREQKGYFWLMAGSSQVNLNPGPGQNVDEWKGMQDQNL